MAMEKNRNHNGSHGISTGMENDQLFHGNKMGIGIKCMTMGIMTLEWEI